MPLPGTIKNLENHWASLKILGLLLMCLCVWDGGGVTRGLSGRCMALIHQEGSSITQ